VGYFYGIARARYFGTYSYFIFDAAVLGLYLSQLDRLLASQVSSRLQALWQWFYLLTGVPILMLCLSPLFPNSFVVQLVGLRSAVWFLPFLLLGALANAKDFQTLARALAVLNLLVLVIALGEYVLGVERFYPRNAATDLIYRSNDVAGYTAYRIPGTFVHSAVFGGTMVLSLPILLGRWQIATATIGEKALLLAGGLAGTLGVFLSASRTAAVLLFVLGTVICFHLRGRLGAISVLVLLGAVVGYLVKGDVRLQRFLSLEDSQYVSARVSVGVSQSLFHLVAEYPMGNGLGGAFGTSIPSFLVRGEKINQVGVESEYSRILLEQSPVGLLIWVAFLVWLLVKKRGQSSRVWSFGSRLMYWIVALTWVTALIGAGLLLAVPAAALTLLQMGNLAQNQSAAVPAGAKTLRAVPGENLRFRAQVPQPLG
jgi:hypothetical protein